MPGLIACNRRWDIGSDDLLLPAAVEMSFRLMWLIAIVVIYDLHAADLHCSTGYYMQIFYVSRMTFICIHVLLDMFIIFISTRGSIMDVRKRRFMPQLLYTKLAVFLPEFVLYSLATYWTFELPTDCSAYIMITAKIAVIGGWLFLFFLLIAVFVVFDPLGSQSRTDTGIHATKSKGDTDELYPTKMNAKKIWELRCKLLCCCANCDEQSNNAFNDVAQLLTNFFEGLDLVPTDIASGLMLVQYEQATQPRSLQHEPVAALHLSGSLPSISERTDADVDAGDGGPRESDSVPESTADPQPVPKPWMNIYNASYYMKFALSIYTWPLYIYMHPMTGCCKLTGGCRCCQCIASNGAIIEDNCCHCHMAAIQKMTGIDTEDVIYASFYNRVYEIPFFVCVDHNKQSIVIAIRGTLSLRDALTDMTAECSDLNIEGIGCMQAHKGILQAAKYIKETLEKQNILEKALEKGPGYNLVITGHSLGAGAAALLAILLKPDYPDLTCFSFSPPGGLLCLPLSRYTEDFVCSVVVGMDLIPRLSLGTMEDLKIKMLRCVRDCSKPKYQILAGGVTRALCGCGSPSDDTPTRRHLLDGNGTRTHYTIDMPDNSDTARLESSGAPAASGNPVVNPSVDPDQVDITSGDPGSAIVNDQLPCDQDEQAIDDAIVSTHRTRMARQLLYPPGQIIFIEETNPQRHFCGDANYEAAWARAEVFDEVLVSPRMVMDHLPDVVQKALDQLADRNYVTHQVVRKRATTPVPC